MPSSVEPYLPSAATFGESDGVDSATAPPSVEEALPIIDANPPKASDDELGGVIVAPGLVKDLLIPDMVSSSPSSVTGSTSAVVVALRSPSPFGLSGGAREVGHFRRH